MPKKRVTMRKLVEILRLREAGLSARQIARSCGVARSTVGTYLERMREAGVQWPLGEGVGDEELERQLFGGRGPTRERDKSRPIADWGLLHKELHRKGVTLRLLWEEYQQEHEAGYGYSQFCAHYREWRKGLEVSMRQVHRGGERLFVDYAGMTMPVKSAASGEVREAQIFVAAMGASHRLYAEATWTQQLPDWIEAHIHALAYYQGVPSIIVVDNLKSGVARACRYDPDLNPTYHDMARHYGVAIIPTRPRHPRDNAKAESGVQVIERRVLAALRQCTFFSLGELNESIGRGTEEVNRRPMQKLGVSRDDLFEELDRPALRPLPATQYELAEFMRARVNIDYHIEVQRHYYSVPYDLRGRQVEVWQRARTVEVGYRGRRVAAHQRDNTPGGYTTEVTHMPRAHREQLAWTPSRIIRWADSIGPHCGQAVRQIIESREHPEQGYRAALGIIRLANRHGAERVDAACRRALALDVCRYRHIKSILVHGKEHEPLPGESGQEQWCRTHHQNVRGAGYYAAHYGERREVAHAE